MKTEAQHDANILEMLAKIKNNYPQLSKKLLEIPFDISITQSSGVSDKALTDYQNSLVALFDKFELNPKVNKKMC